MGEWKQGEQCPQDIYDGTDFVVGVPDSIVAKRVCDKHNVDIAALEAELAAANETITLLVGTGGVKCSVCGYINGKRRLKHAPVIEETPDATT